MKGFNKRYRQVDPLVIESAMKLGDLLDITFYPSNRKFFLSGLDCNLKKRCYVNLQEISTLIAKGKKVRIVKHTDFSDVTVDVLKSIIRMRTEQLLNTKTDAEIFAEVSL